MKLLAASLFFAVISWGQCAMCFRTAESQTRARAEALNMGILIMLVPLAGGAGIIGWLAYGRRAREGPDALSNGIGAERSAPIPLGMD
ncbi:MAG: hypothetical protein ACKV2U_29760 [Bryobacteraceae bacterium]